MDGWTDGQISQHVSLPVPVTASLTGMKHYMDGKCLANLCMLLVIQCLLCATSIICKKKGWSMETLAFFLQQKLEFCSLTCDSALTFALHQ